MGDRPLHLLAANVASACSKLQSVVSDELQTSLQHGLTGAPHPSVTALGHLLREHEELLMRLRSSDQAGGRPEDHAEIAAVAAKREQVLTQGLTALGSIAVSMRAVLDDVSELAPEDNGYLPNVQELLSFGHRLRYTTFATTGLYSGEPAPQQLHFDHATLWERALAERHQQMAGPGAGGTTAAAGAAVDPEAEAACRTLLSNLVDAGWTPEAGFPEPVLAFLSDMPGALDILRRLVEERFFGSGEAGPVAGAGPPATGEPAAAAVPAVPAAAPAPAVTQNPASRLVRELMLDEDTDEEGSSSQFTTTEDESD